MDISSESIDGESPVRDHSTSQAMEDTALMAQSESDSADSNDFTSVQVINITASTLNRALRPMVCFSGNKSSANFKKEEQDMSASVLVQSPSSPALNGIDLTGSSMKTGGQRPRIHPSSSSVCSPSYLLLPASCVSWIPWVLRIPSL